MISLFLGITGAQFDFFTRNVADLQPGNLCRDSQPIEKRTVLASAFDGNIYNPIFSLLSFAKLKNNGSP